MNSYFCAMKRGPIPVVNMAHNTASSGYRGGELDDDSTPVSRPLNMAHNTLPQVFARMGLLPLYYKMRYAQRTRAGGCPPALGTS